jgi:hypothetical protein
MLACASVLGLSPEDALPRLRNPESPRQRLEAYPAGVTARNRHGSPSRGQR